MAAVMFLLFGAGGLLVAAGWFGRRLDDHPWCVKCGHDLFGVSDSTRCAECGADLTQRRATRRGHRRKRPAFALLGALVIAGSLTWGALDALTWARAVNWERHKPVWWLMNSAHADTADTRRGALEELWRRVRLGQISEARLLNLARTGLKYQADADTEWEPLWGLLIEQAMGDGLLSADQIKEYFDHALEFSLSASPNMRWDYASADPYDTLPSQILVPRVTGTGPVPTVPQWTCIELNMQMNVKRGAHQSDFQAGCVVRRVWIGETSVPFATADATNGPAMIGLTRGYPFAHTVVTSAPVNVPAGDYTIRAEISIDLFGDARGTERLHSMDVALSAPLEVTAPAEEAVMFATDGASSDLLRETMRIEIIGIRHLPTGHDDRSTSPGLFCSASAGKSNRVGMNGLHSTCPFNGKVQLVISSAGNYITSLAFALPFSTTWNHIHATDLSSLDLIVRPDLSHRVTTIVDEENGRFKPVWMGPEFTVHLDDVRWYDSIDDPDCPAEYREMILGFLEMWERMDRRNLQDR